VRHFCFSSRRTIRRCSGFTLVELLTVITIIAILTGLVLGLAGYAHRKAASSRAETEIAGLSVACESYKADNGIYPRLSGTTEPTTSALSDGLAAIRGGVVTSGNNDPTAAAYASASLYLYKELSGDKNADRAVDSGQKNYFDFKPNMLLPAGGAGPVTAIIDPFGYSYGYSTANQVKSADGYNPTFDLWSTAGNKTASDQPKWLKNW
jgi:prepilin-type N-terminal cleavage/methylation domain-containing protein